MTRYEYDCQHRLIKVIKPTGIITTYSYDPFVGRYITQDPLGLISNFNFYQYCSDPINEIDPLGLISGLNNKTQNPWNALQKAHKGQFADVKEAAKAYAKLKAEQSPWPIGFTPIER